MTLKTLGDYLEAAQSNHLLKRTTHTYIADMFRYYSRDELFPNIKGNDDQIARMSQYFLGGADRGSLSERLLLLLGPNGTGKTTTCNDLKQGLVRYSRTDAGIAYAVAECPFNQHPFDLVPSEEREAIGIKWYHEAAPCPVCELTLQKHEDNWKKMPITRFYYGPRNGLAEHTASDARREDITEFLGDVDWSMVQKIKGSKSNPEAYDWAGKFVWANRGILDWDEILKSRRQLLTPLLMLTQNKTVAYPKFPKLHIDTVIIGATNWGEYRQALKEDLLEPLFGRAFVVEFVYSLDACEESEIVKLRARQMQQYGKFKGEQVINCINDMVLERYIAELVVSSRRESSGKGGIPPRVTLDIFSNAYMNAAVNHEQCISFQRYRDSYDQILTSEEKKNPELKKVIGLDTATDVKVQENMKTNLWNLVRESACNSSEEFKRFGQSKYLEYLAILEKKQKDAKVSQREEELAMRVAQLLHTESNKRIQDQEPFERIFAQRIGEFKSIHYTQVEKLKPVINEIVSDHLRAILKNYSYDKNLSSESETAIINDIINTLMKSKISCKSCSVELLHFLGENL